MNKSTGSLTLRDYFNIASTQFASILGPGVASGATVLAIFASRGWHASWLTFFGVGLSFVGYYFAMEYARLHQLRNYADVYKGLYGKLYRVATPFMDFRVTCSTSFYNRPTKQHTLATNDFTNSDITQKKANNERFFEPYQRKN